MRDSHVDRGIGYESNDDTDLPVSAPMLFGVKGTTAQIAPMVKYTGNIEEASVREQVIKGKVSYRVSVGTQTMTLVNGDTPTDAAAALVTKGTANIPSGATAYKMDVTKGFGALKLLEKSYSGTCTPVAGEYVYILVASNYEAGLDVMTQVKTGDEIAIDIVSTDHTWDGYTNIVGTRHALVIDDAVAATVAKETSNGAQGTDIPRCAVGVKADGTVVVFMVESLYYGKKAQEGDTHGMSLPELADFICYYGCKTAGNFDGGGSNQLITSTTGFTAEGSDAKVVVRSSDTGSSALRSSRKVMSTLLITSK